MEYELVALDVTCIETKWINNLLLDISHYIHSL